jgi:hypothetical protein
VCPAVRLAAAAGSTKPRRPSLAHLGVVLSRGVDARAGRWGWRLGGIGAVPAVPPASPPGLPPGRCPAGSRPEPGLHLRRIEARLGYSFNPNELIRLIQSSKLPRAARRNRRGTDPGARSTRSHGELRGRAFQGPYLNLQAGRLRAGWRRATWLPRPCFWASRWPTSPVSKICEITSHCRELRRAASALAAPSARAAGHLGIA